MTKGLQVFDCLKIIRFRSEILSSLNINKIKMLSLDWRTTIHWKFSNIIIHVKIVGKILDQHLSVWLFSNPGDQVQILVESMGQICPVVLHLFCTLSSGFKNKHTLKCLSGIFPTILTSIFLLENCQNNISVYGCSPIQGTKFYSR